MRLGLVGLALLCVPTAAIAQSDTISGLDGYMRSVDNAVAKGRTGTFPNGLNGIAIDTTICNTGTVGIDWKQAMDARHPFIAFLVARESSGRFEQISDRSCVKHTFFATNASQCASCTDSSDNTVLAVACSDTYSNNENGDRFWLAPASEIDPWLGVWDPFCSYFDRGDPPVPPPADCDGVRSLTQSQVNAFDGVKNRIVVSDADLNDSTATYWYYGMYMIKGEADALRDDTCASRQMIPSWNGTKWTLPHSGPPIRGSILNQWNGAHVHSNSNGGDDGRVFLASNVTGPDANGIYHYEFAMHNRDNSRGIGALHIPVSPTAKVTNVGFRDIDADPTNDWTFVFDNDELIWSTSTNPLEWNTIYNVWFDCDAAPVSGSRALLEESRAGAGFASFDMVTSAPLGPSIGTNLGFGKTGSNGVVPNLTMTGGLNVGDTGDLMVRYALPNTTAFLFLADTNGSFSFRGGVIVPFPPDILAVLGTDGAGRIVLPFTGIGGTFDVFLQLVLVDPAASGQVSMTNALEVVH